MRSHFTTLQGTEVLRVRKALELTVRQFAAVLAVHPSSVHRWEAAGANRSPVDGVALPLIRAILERRGLPGAARAGTAVARALVFDGQLAALGILIAYATAATTRGEERR